MRIPRRETPTIVVTYKNAQSVQGIAKVQDAILYFDKMKIKGNKVIFYQNAITVFNQKAKRIRDVYSLKHYVLEITN